MTFRGALLVSFYKPLSESSTGILALMSEGQYHVVIPNTTQMAAEKQSHVFYIIDQAHAEDPNIITVNGKQIPYELHYSQKMSNYLQERCPSASATLQIAIRAQHLRRWEVPRDSYPMNKVGYHAWRTYLKRRQAEIASRMCLDSGFSAEDASRVAHLIRKEDLKNDEETQVLEDVACLVFLDDQFEEFKKQHDEAKVVRILQKTWIKMSDKGQELALEIPMSERCKELITKALTGG